MYFPELNGITRVCARHGWTLVWLAVAACLGLATAAESRVLRVADIQPTSIGERILADPQVSALGDRIRGAP